MPWRRRFAALLAAYEDDRTASGRQRLVRHGHGPERTILAGIGPVPVRRPNVSKPGGPVRIGSGSLRDSCRGSRGGRSRGYDVCKRSVVPV